MKSRHLPRPTIRSLTRSALLLALASLALAACQRAGHTSSPAPKSAPVLPTGEPPRSQPIDPALIVHAPPAASIA